MWDTTVYMFSSSPSVSSCVPFNFVLLNSLLLFRSVVWFFFGNMHSSVLFPPPVFLFRYMAYLLSTSWSLSLIRRLRTASLFLRASELLLLFRDLLWRTSKYVPISCNDYQNFTKYFWPLARSVCTYL